MVLSVLPVAATNDTRKPMGILIVELPMPDDVDADIRITLTEVNTGEKYYYSIPVELGNAREIDIPLGEYKLTNYSITNARNALLDMPYTIITYENAIIDQKNWRVKLNAKVVRIEEEEDTKTVTKTEDTIKAGTIDEKNIVISKNLILCSGYSITEIKMEYTEAFNEFVKNVDNLKKTE